MEELLKRKRQLEWEICTHPKQIEKGRKEFAELFKVLNKETIQYFLDNMIGYSEEGEYINKKIGELGVYFRQPYYMFITFYFPENVNFYIDIYIPDGHEGIAYTQMSIYNSDEEAIDWESEDIEGTYVTRITAKITEETLKLVPSFIPLLEEIDKHLPFRHDEDECLDFKDDCVDFDAYIYEKCKM